MATSSTSTLRKRQLKEFYRKAHSLLSEDDRDYLYNVLKEYQSYKRVDKLVQCLQSALDTPVKLDLLKDIRNLIPAAHLSLYDQLAPYHKMAHPFVPPIHSTRGTHSAGHSTGHPRQKSRPALNGHISGYQTLPLNRGHRKEQGSFLTVNIDKHPDESLGFSIRGGSEHGLGVYVSEIDPGSVADRSGLQLGDQILEANNVNFDKVASSSAVRVLTGSNRLKLAVKRTGKIPGLKYAREKTSWFDTNEHKIVDGQFFPHGSLHIPLDSQQSDNGVKKVNLTTTKRGEFIGINIRGGSEYGLGIYVSKVDPGGLAEEKGIVDGDQIIAVNGQNFECITHSRAVEFLQTQSQLILTIKHIGKFPVYKEMYAEYSWVDGEPRRRRRNRPATAPPPRPHSSYHLREDTPLVESKVEVFTQTPSPTPSGESYSMAIQTEEVLSAQKDLIMPHHDDVYLQRPSTSYQDSSPGGSPNATLRERPRTPMGMKALNINNANKGATVERTQSLRVETVADKGSKENKKVKRSRTFRELLFGRKDKTSDSSQAGSVRGKSKDKSKAAVKKGKGDKDKKLDETDGKKNGDLKKFGKGVGTQLMLQEAMQGSALKMVEDMARKLLNEDEAAAIVRHVKRYLEERDIESVVPPILAILDKPEKMLLLREIRGVIYPTDLGRFDSMVSRQELEAYEELSYVMNATSPMPMRRSGGKTYFGAPRKQIMEPVSGMSYMDVEQTSSQISHGQFRLKTEEERERENERKLALERIRKEKMEERKRESQKQSNETVPFPKLQAAGDYEDVDDDDLSDVESELRAGSSLNTTPPSQNTSTPLKVSPLASNSREPNPSLPSSINSSPKQLYAVVKKDRKHQRPRVEQNPVYETVNVTFTGNDEEKEEERPGVQYYTDSRGRLEQDSDNGRRQLDVNDSEHKVENTTIQNEENTTVHKVEDTSEHYAVPNITLTKPNTSDNPLPADLSHYDVATPPPLPPPPPQEELTDVAMATSTLPPPPGALTAWTSQESVSTQTAHSSLQEAEKDASTLEDDDDDNDNDDDNDFHLSVALSEEAGASGSMDTSRSSSRSRSAASFTAPPPPDTPPPHDGPMEEDDLTDGETVEAPSTLTIELQKNVRSLGISISGGKDSRTQPTVKVEKVFPGGAAAEQGILKSGMEIISIDGESLQDVTHPQAVDIIRRAYNNKTNTTMEIVVVPLH